MDKFITKEKVGAFVKGEKLSSSVLTAIILGLVIVVNIIVFVLDSYFGWFIFKPSSEQIEISGATDIYFEQAISEGRKVEIVFCRAEDEVAANSAGQFVLQTAKQLAERHEGFISLEFINIIRQVNSKGEHINLADYQEESASGEKIPLLKSSVVFKCEDQVKVLTDGYSSTGYSSFYTLDASGNAYAYNGEEVIASMVMWVMNKEHKTAYFTTYHGETADYGFRNMLICAGYNVETIDIRNNEIPYDETGLIVISNPVKDFERAQEGSGVVTEIERLREYMSRGGNIYVALDPYGERLPVLEEFIAEYGISVATAEVGGERIRSIVRDADNAITADFYTLVANGADTELGRSLMQTVRSFNSADVIVRESAVLEINSELGAEPLLVTSPSAELYAGGGKVGERGTYSVSAISRFVNDEGDVGSIVVAPSVYITATDALTSGGYANREFVYAMMEEVFGSGKPPYGCNTVFYTENVLENLTMGSARGYAVLLMMIPVAIAAVGVVITVRRKNR